MERLAGGVRSAASDAFPDEPPKDFYLCAVSDIESLGDGITPSSRHYGLFLAVDGRALDDGRIERIAKNLLQKGLVCLCAWGPDCERVHDLFDHAALEMDPNQETAVIMTTWHSDETLPEAIWYFANCAFPDDAYTNACRDWIFAPIGHSDWEKTIRESQPSRTA